MKYYNVALLGNKIEPLTYASKLEFDLGDGVEVLLRGKKTKGVIVKKVKKPSFECINIEQKSEFYYDASWLELAKFISTYYICSLGEALGIMVPHKRVKSEFETFYSKCSITLSTKQQEALSFIKKHKISLLFGDTGSGKTEIFMSYFEDLLKSKKRALFLLPEISLTPQMSKRLKEHFGDEVVFWHSKLTKKQKEQNLELIHNGKAKIVAGPRSALFLPIKDLGLIVVDEEHDDSYKSTQTPHYNARDLAMYMGKIFNISVLLASATPSLNSYYKVPHFRLRGSYFNSKKEYIYEKAYESLSPLVLSHIDLSLKNASQVILFVPTRANFKYLLCSNCGQSVKCDFCSVSMSVHTKQNLLKCHYCNATKAIPKKCKECGNDELVSSRLGSAQITKELRKTFKNAVIEQFDRDVITTQKKLTHVLSQFNDKKIDVLVGTQMLSKGHDYHGVDLAVILGIDNILSMPDYRSAHKALSTLLQVGGRSGRSGSAKVVVQTLNSEFFSQYVDDFELFLKDDLELKKGLYPPFKRLSRIIFSHKNDIKCAEAINEMVFRFKSFSDVEIVGYGRCSIEMLSLKYRYEILLRSDKSSSLIKAIHACLVDGAMVDMDPLEFL